MFKTSDLLPECALETITRDEKAVIRIGAANAHYRLPVAAVPPDRFIGRGVSGHRNIPQLQNANHLIVLEPRLRGRNARKRWRRLVDDRVNCDGHAFDATNGVDCIVISHLNEGNPAVRRLTNTRGRHWGPGHVSLFQKKGCGAAS